MAAKKDSQYIAFDDYDAQPPVLILADPLTLTFVPTGTFALAGVAIYLEPHVNDDCLLQEGIADLERYLAWIAGNVAGANGYLVLLDTARRGEQTRVDNEDGTITYTTRHLWLEYDQIIDTWDTAAEYRQTTIQEEP